MEKTLWEIYNDTQLAELETLTADYKDFLDAGKTERECVTEVIRLAEKEGYVDLNQKDTLQAGDKVYLDWMGKSIVLFQIGEDPLENGMNILGAHVDSPRCLLYTSKHTLRKSLNFKRRLPYIVCGSFYDGCRCYSEKYIRYTS